MNPNSFKVVTELGDEKQCISCGEYWPADTEFFEARRATRDRLSNRCIACSKEGVWILYRGGHPAWPVTPGGAGS